MQNNIFSMRNEEKLDDNQLDTEASDVLFAISVVSRNLARSLREEGESDDDQRPS